MNIHLLLRPNYGCYMISYTLWYWQSRRWLFCWLVFYSLLSLSIHLIPTIFYLSHPMVQEKHWALLWQWIFLWLYVKPMDQNSYWTLPSPIYVKVLWNITIHYLLWSFQNLKQSTKMIIIFLLTFLGLLWRQKWKAVAKYQWKLYHIKNKLYSHWK